MKKPFTHFDLPTYHLSGDHFVPARAHQEEEAERRRSLPTGTLVREQQLAGLTVLTSSIEGLQDPDDVQFMSRVMGASAMNAGWYTYAEGADVMRRRLFLPTLADDETGFRQTHEGIREQLRSNLATAVELAGITVASHRNRLRVPRLTMQFGRALGNSSLLLEALLVPEPSETDSAVHIQRQMRQASLRMLNRSRMLHGEVGTNPSLAQLADPDSDTSVFIRRKAPTDARDAFIRASEELQGGNYAA